MTFLTQILFGIGLKEGSKLPYNGWQFMAVAVDALTGQLPKELGNLSVFIFLVGYANLQPVIYHLDKKLAINCGGQEIISSDHFVYERDDETLGPATYFVSNSKRWAVSNVGHFTGKNNPPYIYFSPRQFAKTLDSELFQTSRLSASSLRYDGLGLENGNYNMNLQFAEVAFDDSSSWISLGRRERLVFKNFDIRKEADGIASQSVHMIFKAQLLKNYLEIHLFWAVKGTSSIPIEGTYGPSISAISATLDFDPTVNVKPTTFKRKRTSPAVGLGIGSGVLSILFILMISYVVQRRKKSKSNDNEELLGLEVTPFTFSYNELKTATNNFSSDIKLEKEDLDLSTREHLEMEELLLSSNCLKHPTRKEPVCDRNCYNLCCATPDIEASNILLDSDPIPKISDFGLARLNDNEKTHITTRVAGTM
ncbi:hypothetical protein FEM48_Zijuj05G0039000 [Ziziphus jujuba var. spinosa]|uniref:non-specific serine/threonine protein kinase n=1 Tax=Ziziphus jujuba var. spinosa TaxID=714518 RepID=A0A978VCP0_ZIZJJ|nr:hypothetical protein FEM48_Zijuj05G0039000 [Ziziphus jujuba var. spinosa]